MLAWLSAHGGDILVLLVLALIVGVILRSLIRDKKKGKSACGCSCKGCSLCGGCDRKEE